MSLLEADVEIVKLARLLGTDAGELGFLRQIEWRKLRDLRPLARRGLGWRVRG